MRRPAVAVVVPDGGGGGEAARDDVRVRRPQERRERPAVRAAERDDRAVLRGGFGLDVREQLDVVRKHLRNQSVH